MGNKPPFKGHDSYAAGTEVNERNFGSAPRVGQSKPYQSGSNARGKHERPMTGPAPGSSGGKAPASQPRQSGYKGG